MLSLNKMIENPYFNNELEPVEHKNASAECKRSKFKSEDKNMSAKNKPIILPFSTRGTTLERIATVMEIEPEEFEEYKIPQEPLLIDENVQFLKQVMKEKGMSTVNFLKAFPRKKRLEIVDILRGNIPIPIDYKELSMIAQVLDIDKDDIYDMWEKRMKQVLETSGMNIYSNAALVNAMFDCAKKYIDIQ